MKIVIFGSTGGSGQKVVDKALAAGHDVVAVARMPEAITLKHYKLTVVKGDILDVASIDAAIAGADAIVSTVGPANNKEPGTLLSDGIANITAAATRAGVKRVVFESGLMVSDAKALSMVGRIGVKVFRAMNKKLYVDKLKAETTLKNSALEYVIVRPPSLVHAPGTGKYIVGTNAKVNPAKALSHEDAADFLVKAATDPQWARQTVEIGH